MVYGQKARLVSRLLRGTSRPQCLIFFYHMYGAGTGILNVYVKKYGEVDETLLWRRRGEQSITWLKGLIEYTCDTYHQVSQRYTGGQKALQIQNSDRLSSESASTVT